jgi:hypothetical protein
VPEIDHPGVALMRLCQRPHQAPRLTRNGDQMNMRIHQTVRPDFNGVEPGEPRQQAKIFRLVFIPEEDTLIAIAALDDVVREMFDNHSSNSGHGLILRLVESRFKVN